MDYWKRKRKVKKHLELFGQLCFWIAIITETLMVLIDKSAYINPYEGILFRLTFCLFCLKILATKYTRKEWLAMIIVGLIAVISYLVNDKDEIVRVVALVAACKGIEIKKITKVLFWETLVGCTIIAGLSVFGIYGEPAMTAYFGTNSATEQIIETRYILGMGHPNALQCMVLMITVLGMYTYIDQMKWYHFVLAFLFNLGIYSLSDSNTGIIAGILFIFGVVVMRYCKPFQDNKWIYLCGVGILLFCVVFSVLGVALEVSENTRDTMMFRIDTLLNGRFQTTYAFEDARLVNWKLFSAPENTGFFDPAFVRIAYWYGSVPFLMYLLMNLYLIKIGYKKKDYVLFVIVLTFAVYSIMEAHLISVYILRNYLFIFMGVYFFGGIEKCR